jgi:hypothetical protein
MNQMCGDDEDHITLVVKLADSTFQKQLQALRNTAFIKQVETARIRPQKNPNIIAPSMSPQLSRFPSLHFFSNAQRTSAATE